MLINLSPARSGEVIPTSDSWVTSRQISDAMNISIYRTRLLLLNLVECNQVMVSKGEVDKFLRWYPINTPAHMS